MLDAALLLLVDHAKEALDTSAPACNMPEPLPPCDVIGLALAWDELAALRGGFFTSGAFKFRGRENVPVFVNAALATLPINVLVLVVPLRSAQVYLGPYSFCTAWTLIRL